MSAAAYAAFSSATFTVTPQSNRTGFRFAGPDIPVVPDPGRLSEPTAPGAIQLPPDGRPILLLADRNTTGGYPRLGYLCSADRPRAAQLWPGDPVRFVPVSLDQARDLARGSAGALANLVQALPAWVAARRRGARIAADI